MNHTDGDKIATVPIHCAHDKLVDITTLVPNPRNPNRHLDKQIELLAKIIQNQGWRAPITVSTRSGFIVRGHGRLRAAQKLGLAHVPVDRQDYATEAEEWADMIADNQISDVQMLKACQKHLLLRSKTKTGPERSRTNHSNNIPFESRCEWNTENEKSIGNY